LRLDWPIKDKLESNQKLRKLIEKARTDWRKDESKKKMQPATARPKSAPSEKKKKGPKPTLGRLLQLMKHDYIPEDFEEREEIEEFIAELGDLSGIRDGEWPSIHRFECPRLLDCLLEAGLNPEITDKEGNSLLSQCVLNSECIDLLLERGADIDRRSGKHNETALMRAVRMGDKDDVAYLLNAGANPTLEFSSTAKFFLNMDAQKTALLEAARVDWSREQGKEISAACLKDRRRSR
jgi:ankyrin repeat protein